MRGRSERMAAVDQRQRYGHQELKVLPFSGSVPARSYRAMDLGPEGDGVGRKRRFEKRLSAGLLRSAGKLDGICLSGVAKSVRSQHASTPGGNLDGCYRCEAEGHHPSEWNCIRSYAS